MDGKRIYGAYTTREEAAAEAASMMQRAKASAGKVLITFETACQQIIDLAPTPGTKRDYDECCTTLATFFGLETPLHEVTRQRIQDYVAHRHAARWRGKPIGERRIGKELRVLGRVFNVAIRNDQFPGASPLLKIEKPKSKPQEQEHYTIEEFAEFIAAIRQQTLPTAERAWRIVAAFAFSGLRRDELCRLRCEQVDLAAGWLRRVEGKRNVCDVPITKPLAAVLRPLLDGLKGMDHLVPVGEARGPRKEGNRRRSDLERREGIVNGLFRRFREVLPERLRSRFHPHTLRHSVRTWLADAGVPEHVKNAFTRHGRRGEGARYEHVSPLLLRKGVEQVLDPLLGIVDPTANATHEQVVTNA
ncbi:MAG: hypothetical protein FJX72_19105 [Armatimonadetes bacterium]|nr:hypothetical protein [Armatimonadota bacterium]